MYAHRFSNMISGKHLPSNNSSIRIVPCSDQSIDTDLPMKISISSPINLNSPQHDIIGPSHVFPQPNDLFHPTLPTNPYASNNGYCESIEDNPSLQNDCHHLHRSDDGTLAEEEGFVMSVDTIHEPSIHGENKNEISIIPRNNVHFDGLNSIHPSSLSLQNLAKPSSIIQQPPTSLLTTLLPPSSLNNNLMNDVVMTSSSATFSVLRNASPSHLLPSSVCSIGSSSNTNSSHNIAVVEGDMLKCNQEERKPFVAGGNFDPIRECEANNVSMATFETNHCSTLLF